MSKLVDIAPHRPIDHAAVLHQQLAVLGLGIEGVVIDLLLGMSARETLAVTGQRYGVLKERARKMRLYALSAMQRAIRRLPTKEHTAVVLDFIEQHLGAIIKERLGLGVAIEVMAPDDIDRLGDLPVRVRSCFMRLGIRTIADLLECTEMDLRRTPRFGPASWEALKARLDERGLSLATVPTRCCCMHWGADCPVHPKPPPEPIRCTCPYRWISRRHMTSPEDCPEHGAHGTDPRVSARP